MTTMLLDKLPSLHQPLAELIRKIAPDVEVVLDTTTDDRVFVRCTLDGRGLTLRHAEDGHWRTHGKIVETELDLLEPLCWLVDAPRVAGPVDVLKLRGQSIDDDGSDVTTRALAMESAAVLACSRALPNNDWRKHKP